MLGTAVVSILGISNVSDRPLSDPLQLQDFPIDPSRECIVRSTFGTISDRLRLGSSLLFSMDIEISGHGFLCAYPLTGLDRTHGDDTVHVTVLGLKRKMPNAAAIIDSNCIVEGDALCLKTISKGLGILGRKACCFPFKNTLFRCHEAKYKTARILHLRSRST